MKWRKSVGLGANAIWSTKPSRDWFIPNTSLAIPLPFLTRHIRAVLIALCNRLKARPTDFISQLVFGVRMNGPRSGCPINLTLEALGDRWSLIAISDLMFGNRRHFRELLTRSEERIASNILADRLTRLEKAGLVSRRDDPSHKQKVIYSLTEASIALV